MSHSNNTPAASVAQAYRPFLRERRFITSRPPCVGAPTSTIRRRRFGLPGLCDEGALCPSHPRRRTPSRTPRVREVLRKCGATPAVNERQRIGRFSWESRDLRRSGQQRIRHFSMRYVLCRHLCSFRRKATRELSIGRASYSRPSGWRPLSLPSVAVRRNNRRCRGPRLAGSVHYQTCRCVGETFM